MPLPHHDPQGHKRLRCNLILGRVGGYFRTIRTLAPFSLVHMSFDTTTFTTLHLESYGYFPFFLKDYELDQDFEFFFIPSSWHSNACRIYWQVVLLGCFFNTFKIIFT